MKSGVVRGPMELAEICRLYQHAEIGPGDVVRCGSRGLWQRPDQFVEFAAFSPAAAQAPLASRGSRNRFGNQSRTSNQAPISPGGGAEQKDDDNYGDTGQDLKTADKFVPPEKIWSTGNQVQPGVFHRSWNLCADIVGGSNRLKGILLTLIVIGAVTYWWRLPPSNGAIYREFNSSRATLKRLQERRAPRSEWAPVVERLKPRIEGVVDRLKPFANDRNPIENSLYMAADLGLLRLLENPSDPTDAERLFDKYMKFANDFMSGKAIPQSTPNNPK